MFVTSLIPEDGGKHSLMVDNTFSAEVHYYLPLVVLCALYLLQDTNIPILSVRFQIGNVSKVETTELNSSRYVVANSQLPCLLSRIVEAVHAHYDTHHLPLMISYNYSHTQIRSCFSCDFKPYICVP